MSITDLAGFGKFADKLLDTLKEVGVGICAPMQIRRVGRANTDVKAEEIRAIAAAQKDAEDISKGIKVIDEHGKVVPAPIPVISSHEVQHVDSDLNPDSSAIILNARSRFLYRELKRELNIRAIVLLALEEAIKDEEVSDKRVDDQWTARWIDSAQDVSEESVRILWAKILAGEVKRPGTYSLRTIAYLRNISVREAKKIERIAGRAIKDFYDSTALLYIDQGAMEDVPYHLLLELEEEGIINTGGDGFSVKPAGVKTKGREYIFQFGTSGLHCVSDIPEKVLRYHAYRFTRLGTEIVSLGNFKMDDGYLLKFIQGAKNAGFRVYHLFEMTVKDGVPHHETKVER